MDRLSAYLRRFITERIQGHGGWRALRVVFSDASVPGEGEHKIMEFIRQQRAQPGYSPNVRHALHGLDADLIMLGLATHEPHFTIVREDIGLPGGKGGKPAEDKCFLCGQTGHRSDACQGYVHPSTGAAPTSAADTLTNASVADVDTDPNSLTSLRSLIKRKPLQVLHLPILREYLDLEFRAPLQSLLPFPFDIERIIDDFVFLCFFVGNDFLPHLPSMDIREGAIDLLMRMYKALLPAMGGYMTHNGHVYLRRVDVLLARVGEVEDEIFRRRRARELKDERFTNERHQQQTLRRKDIMSRQDAEAAAAAQSAQSAAALNARGLSTAMLQVQAALNDGVRRLQQGQADGPKKEGGAKDGEADAKKRDVTEPATREKKAEETVEEAEESVLPPKKKRKTKAAAVAAVALPEIALVAATAASAAPVFLPGLGGVASASAEATVATAPASQPTGTADASAEGEIDLRDLDGSIGPSAVSQEQEDDAGPSETEEEEDEDGQGPPAILEPVAEGDAAAEGELTRASAAMLKMAIEQALRDRHTKEGITDEVQLGNGDGWRDRYYDLKFGKGCARDTAFRRRIVQCYVEGLVWVFRYYYQGVASWNWFYPFHYAPFASDLRNLDQLTVRFELGRPFRPLDQLMAVLPPRSSHALPAACADLMVRASSPILDFYPEQFDMDPNGKKFTWLWVVLLPFIDEKRLVAALDSVLHTFTPEETRRNTIGNEVLFVHSQTGMGRHLAPLLDSLDGPGAARTEGGRPALAIDTADSLASTAVGEDLNLASGEGLYVENAPTEVTTSATTTASVGEGASRQAAEAIQPAISPAVADALAKVYAATPEERTPCVVLRPDIGDASRKGFSARVVTMEDGGGKERGVFSLRLGGQIPSPWPGVLAPIEGNKVVFLTFLPPPRRAHDCGLLPGLELPPRLLDPMVDDPSGRVPKLSRGFSIVDLAAYMGSTASGAQQWAPNSSAGLVNLHDRRQQPQQQGYYPRPQLQQGQFHGHYQHQQQQQQYQQQQAQHGYPLYMQQQTQQPQYQQYQQYPRQQQYAHQPRQMPAYAQPSYGGAAYGQPQPVGLAAAAGAVGGAPGGYRLNPAQQSLLQSVGVNAAPFGFNATAAAQPTGPAPAQPFSFRGGTPSAVTAPLQQYPTYTAPMQQQQQPQQFAPQQYPAPYGQQPNPFPYTFNPYGTGPGQR
jgi:5'-3' exonuclease